MMQIGGFLQKSVWVLPLWLLLATGAGAQTDSSTQKTNTAQKESFQDTAGGYGYMYLSITCYECNPKGLVYYKKFALISGFYKVKDFYSSVATQSVDHFRKKYEDLGYFKDKTTQIWKSPKLFETFAEVKEYRDDLIAKLKSENYVVVFFDDMIKPGEK